jgi:hypothetical protein
MVGSALQSVGSFSAEKDCWIRLESCWHVSFGFVTMKEPYLLQGYEMLPIHVPNLSPKNGTRTMECVSQPGRHVEWW